MIKKLLGTLVIFISMCTISLAEQEPVEMASTMRSNGKIYVVVAVVVAILIGLFVYLLALDRKISKIEKGKF
jgi:CcmD family protein